MKNYSGVDGLVLCVIKGKKNILHWIEEIDLLDHSILSCEQLTISINNLLNGDLIYFKQDKFILSRKAKFILRGSFFMGAIDWQLSVQKRITKYSYDESKENTFSLVQEEYDDALKRYQEHWDKFIAKWCK